MNITHVTSEEIREVLKGRDLLECMSQTQYELLRKYVDIEKRMIGHDITPPVNIHSHKGQAIIKDYMWRIVEELGEAANCLKNKPWKQTSVETDLDHFYEELMDAWHFMLELFILVDIDHVKLTHIYVAKALVNKFRQKTNY